MSMGFAEALSGCHGSASERGGGEGGRARSCLPEGDREEDTAAGGVMRPASLAPVV